MKYEKTGAFKDISKVMQLNGHKVSTFGFISVNFLSQLPAITLPTISAPSECCDMANFHVRQQQNRHIFKRRVREAMEHQWYSPARIYSTSSLLHVPTHLSVELFCSCSSIRSQRRHKMFGQLPHSYKGGLPSVRHYRSLSRRQNTGCFPQ